MKALYCIVLQLQLRAAALAPVIDSVLATLLTAGVLLARKSGVWPENKFIIRKMLGQEC